MKKIIRNAFRCKKCGETVVSEDRHHFAHYKCGNSTDMEDLSEHEEDDA